METLFLDTSVFEANNFFDSHRIREIYKLAENEHIRVIIPQSTYDEIENRLFKHITQAVLRFEKLRTGIGVLKNLDSPPQEFSPMNEEKTKAELSDKLKETFDKAKFEILPYPTINIKDIFRSYLNKDFPFGKAGKKSEFPDAFALTTIEMWAKENSTKVLVFAKDNDILNYKGEMLEIVQSFESYLSNKIKEVEFSTPERIAQLEEYIHDNVNNLNKELENWVEEQLDDFTLFYDYTNFLEIHYMEIKDVSVDIEEFYITGVQDEYFTVQLKVHVNYTVELEIDDQDSMYKDYDTKEWHFYGTARMEHSDIKYIYADLSIAFDKDSSDIIDHEFEAINDGQRLNV